MGSESAGRWFRHVAFVLAIGCGLWLTACGQGHTDQSGDDDREHGESHDPAAGKRWSVTAWGSQFEIYPETDPLIAGEIASAHVHVTHLDGSSPVADGAVEIVFRSPSGEEAFRSEAPVRPGIFNVAVEPSSPGEFDLSFRIETPAAKEEIRGGRVRVGSRQQPGGILVAPAPKGGDGGEPLPFLKEEQWRSDFSTSWVRRGELARSLGALVRVRPPAGGERLLSSPLAGVVSAGVAWPYPGQPISRGAPLLRVTPLVAGEHSLAELEASAASFEIERTALRGRLARLEELLVLEATSRREVEEVRHRTEILEAQRAAAESDLEAARATRAGLAHGAIELDAPFDGEVAEVSVTPGATIAAGDDLVRVVRTDMAWLEAALSPMDAAQLAPGQPLRGLVLTPRGGREPIELSDVRLVSVAPEVSARTGKVAAFFEVGTPGAGGSQALALGVAMDAVILLGEVRLGVVIPSTALVDDGGVTVVYLQLSGESFLRQEVHVVERQGSRVLVDGLEPGQRLVHRGGDAIRRASLMSSGEAHGHVH
ncbi:MAG: HlyD family efflux transporter periplasmic adaptor subunit [Acidobacteriota bacterium]